MKLSTFSFKRFSFLLSATAVWFGILPLSIRTETIPSHLNDPLTGARVDISADWVGRKRVPENVSILIMAGHADSQSMEGAGTAGEAVSLKGAKPMDKRIRDELFWNIKVLDATVKLGRQRGLKISGYDPGVRRILDENDPRTNWSVGFNHSQKGGYPIEIHFDAYGKDGYGSGLIPAFSKEPNTIDESLANSFGRYPIGFRGGLGASRRNIRILELGKLEGKLEAKLRDEKSRQATLNALALRIVDALLIGIGRDSQASVNSVVR